MLRPNKKIGVVPVSRPSLLFPADPKHFLVKNEKKRILSASAAAIPGYCITMRWIRPQARLFQCMPVCIDCVTSVSRTLLFGNMARHVVAVEITRCIHQPGRKQIKAFSSTCPLKYVFDDLHSPTDTSICEKKSDSFAVSVGGFDVDSILSVGEVVQTTCVSTSNTLTFRCLHDVHDTASNFIEECAQTANKRTVDAFQILMAKGRTYPDKKTQRFGEDCDRKFYCERSYTPHNH
jgi:hypothetical protein